jgi:hypothetical protein
MPRHRVSRIHVFQRKFKKILDTRVTGGYIYNQVVTIVTIPLVSRGVT